MPSRLVHMTTFHLDKRGEAVEIYSDGGVRVYCTFWQLAEVCRAMHEAQMGTIVESDQLPEVKKLGTDLDVEE
ncbi:MAG TPA: hypothetical protein VEL31_18120 [Ktedonobacteraceae bacterium]|nr:hypothetical protein [Ktedonobacteraceae bacterium]